jgi:two-component system cell cycle response regulator
MNKLSADLILGLGDPNFPLETKASAGKSVLIAEDDPLFRRMIERCFERWDYRVTVVENGLDAWEVLQRDDAPQMAILDWMMPGMDGLELCRKIRSRDEGPYRYVLLLTARDDKQDVVAGLEAGADDYLTKPFEVDELRARVRAGERILDLQAALLHSQGELRSVAAHDSLTGLWNRGAIYDLLKGELSRHARSRSTLGLIMADIDHFKTINDMHGHPVGDVVLKEVSRRLAANVRPYDAVGRYGGEEFLIVLPACNGPHLVVGAERLRRCIADQVIETGVGQIPVTLSLGLASVEQGEKESPDCETFVRHADEALYAAKDSGRDRACAWREALHAPVTNGATTSS